MRRLDRLLPVAGRFVNMSSIMIQTILGRSAATATLAISQPSRVKIVGLNGDIGNSFGILAIRIRKTNPYKKARSKQADSSYEMISISKSNGQRS